MTYVRNPSTEEILLCCWDDCERYGHNEHQLTFRQDGKDAIYIFCGPPHRALHKNSHREYGRLAMGERGLIAPRPSPRPNPLIR